MCGVLKTDWQSLNNDSPAPIQALPTITAALLNPIYKFNRAFDRCTIEKPYQFAIACHKATIANASSSTTALVVALNAGKQSIQPINTPFTIVGVT
jgi:hypothetical protein